MLYPEQGTATKVYRPPGVVRLIYWLAFPGPLPIRTQPRRARYGYFPKIPEARRKDAADNVPFFRFEKETHTLMDIDISLTERTFSQPTSPALFDLETDPYEIG